MPHPNDWHIFSIAHILKHFNTRKSGLTQKEADKRLQEYGLNKVPKARERATPLKIFLSQWDSPLVFLLVIASVISLFIGEYIDALVIIATAFINAVVGFFQENKANRALLHLQTFMEEWAVVLRDGQVERIKAEEVVPGDILIIEAGDKINADARLLHIEEFQTDEAPLTGESTPVHKTIGILSSNTSLADRTNMCFMGTRVTRGRAQAIVVATGNNTEFGKIAELIKHTTDEPTPLQNEIHKLGNFLVKLVLVLSIFILVFGLWRGFSFVQMFTLAIAVAIAAIPEGLVISMTIILAIGMHRILKRGALVRKLVSAETLGSVSVIATDKTGTLTLGSMRVTEFYTTNFDFIGHNHRKTPLLPSVLGKRNFTVDMLWKTAFFCNDAVLSNPSAPKDERIFIGDPTEVALKRFIYDENLDLPKLNSQWNRIASVPFDSNRKYMAVVCAVSPQDGTANQKIWLLAKGAPEIILSRSSYIYYGARKIKLTEEKIKIWKQKIDNATSRGFRVMGFAARELASAPAILNPHQVHELVFLGIVCIQDPLRPDVKEAFETTRSAGIRTIMITGDYPLTAKAVGKELGLDVSGDNAVVVGSEIEKLNDAALMEVVSKTNIFARVDPKHKVRILDALQKDGNVVAMTGDGVNDAPALKDADIGVAVGSGTQIAKETADLVLLDNNFHTIVKAVEQGRFIFDNIKKVVLYLMMSVFSEVIIIVGALLFSMPLPIFPVQILWVNIVEDSFPNVALAFEHGEHGVMSEPPRPQGTRIIDANMKRLIFIGGIISDLVLFAIALYMFKNNFAISHLRTVVFAGLGVNSLFYIYACRSFRYTIFHKNPFSNKYLNLTILIGLGLMLIAIYTPLFQKLLHTVALGFVEWVVVIGFGILQLILIEITKYFLIIRRARYGL